MSEIDSLHVNINTVWDQFRQAGMEMVCEVSHENAFDEDSNWSDADTGDEDVEELVSITVRIHVYDEDFDVEVRHV